ncbi:MAG TPA: hypothetical protein VKA21_06940 [Candidatus Binatia bacterium]|nr:hypothetical protein [Candidatus Binatia bacterium]
MSQAAPKALVLLRVDRGAPAPDERQIRAAIAEDRARIALPPADVAGYHLAGPYPVEVDGRSLDEYVAWET